MRDEQSRMGTAVSSSVAYDYSVLSLRCTRPNFDRSWQMFTDVALHPSFAKEDVALEQERLVVSLRDDTGVVSYVPGDLTLTVRAGTTLGEIERVTLEHDQWLPLDPYGSNDGTIGATIATASAGPLAATFGLPRALGRLPDSSPVLTTRRARSNGCSLRPAFSRS